MTKQNTAMGAKAQESADRTDAKTAGREAETSAAPAKTGPALKFKTKRRVTLPIRKMAIGVPAFLRPTDPMFKGKKLETDDEQKEPVDLLNVVDLETGENMQVVVGKVLKGILEEEYEDGSYVGVNFRIVKGEKKSKNGGQGYHPYSVEEIELEG